MSNLKGFSLIEILVVLVIMGLLISVVAPTVLNSADDARLQKAQADFKSIETALKIYRLDNFVYPSTEQGLEALVSPSTLAPEPRNFKRGGYLSELPLDPWGRPYLYLSPWRISRDLISTLWVLMACPGERIKTLISVTGKRVRLATSPQHHFWACLLPRCVGLALSNCWWRYLSSYC